MGRNLNGFVKLHRKLIEWGWYSDSVVKCVFLHLLMIAAWKPGEYLGYQIKPGQAIVGFHKLSKDLGFTTQQVRTAIKKLESTGEISRFSTNRFSIVTIENWEFYQGDDEDANKQITNEQQTNNKQITNEQQHLKKDKNKRIKEIYIGRKYSGKLLQALCDFEDMRNTTGKPMTERARNLMLNRLEDLSGGDKEKAVMILDQSIENCWAKLYPLPGDKEDRDAAERRARHLKAKEEQLRREEELERKYREEHKEQLEYTHRNIDAIKKKYGIGEDNERTNKI